MDEVGSESRICAPGADMRTRTILGDMEIYGACRRGCRLLIMLAWGVSKGAHINHTVIPLYTAVGRQDRITRVERVEPLERKMLAQ